MRYQLTVRGKRRVWDFFVDIDPRDLAAYNVDGLELSEVIAVIDCPDELYQFFTTWNLPN